MAPAPLPVIVREGTKGRCALGGIALGLLFYAGSNRLTEGRAVELPMTALDVAIPFLPHTFWIYVSESGLFAAAYFLSRDHRNFNRYLYAIVASYAAGAGIFLLWPTAYPRGDFPLPADLDAATAWAFATFRKYLDAPTNCLPSLHVASCYLSAFLFLHERRRLFPWLFAWATAVGVSTLTTKQHYVVDVVAGLLYAILFYALFFRLARYRLTPTQQPSPSGTMTD